MVSNDRDDSPTTGGSCGGKDALDVGRGEVGVGEEVVGDEIEAVEGDGYVD